MDLHQTKKFSIAKETINKTKRHPTGSEKTFASDIFHKGFMFKIYKELVQFNTKKSIQLKKQAEDPNRHFSKRTQMANRYEKMLKITNQQRNAN